MASHSFTRTFDELEAEGRIALSLDELTEQSRTSPEKARAAAFYARRTGRLRSPTRGLYVLVPVAHRERGDVPIDWFIEDWMAHVGRRYRLSGLTAAARHGARHQAVQSYDVVVDRALVRRAGAWPERIRFFTDRLERPTQRVETPYAPLTLATRETCAFDLATWTEQAGGPSHVATALAELELDPDALAAQALTRPLSVVRRLGFLLERAQPHLPLQALQEISSGYATPTPLVASGPAADERDPRWNLLVNASVELDEL